MFDRITLAEDLVDCRGQVVARRGTVASAESIADAAQRAPRLERRPITATPLAADLALALEEPAYEPLFRGEAAAPVERALRAIALPEILYEELAAVRRAAPATYDHALVAAAVASRMLLAAAGESRGIPGVAAAALLHDLGMRHLPARLLGHRDRLSRADAAAIAAHPLVGALHLASVLGDHPAVAAARCHHWRCGQGYPALSAPPSRAIEVVGVASAFAALTRPRPFRSRPYDARGAADVLVDEVVRGHADANTVRLLVHALRGGKGDVRQVRFAHPRDGHAPEVNRHGSVAPPDRSPV